MEKRIQRNNINTFKKEKKSITAKNIECVDRTPIVIEASSDGRFLKPIILIEDGIAKTTKYCLRRTKKGMLRLE